MRYYNMWKYPWIMIYETNNAIWWVLDSYNENLGGLHWINKNTSHFYWINKTMREKSTTDKQMFVITHTPMFPHPAPAWGLPL